MLIAVNDKMFKNNKYSAEYSKTYTAVLQYFNTCLYTNFIKTVK